jgi:hypothetical protein
MEGEAIAVDYSRFAGDCHPDVIVTMTVEARSGVHPEGFTLKGVKRVHPEGLSLKGC